MAISAWGNKFEFHIYSISHYFYVIFSFEVLESKEVETWFWKKKKKTLCVNNSQKVWI